MRIRLYPRPRYQQIVYLKDVVTGPNIEVGDYTIYNDFVHDPREFEQNNQERSPWEIVHVPDFGQAVMNRPDYFTFDLPISAFDLPDDIVMEVSVDYTRSEEQPIYLANVWARVKDSDSKHFLFSPAIPADEDAARCIVEYLNEDDKFKRLMECFALDVARSFK